MRRCPSLNAPPLLTALECPLSVVREPREEENTGFEGVCGQHFVGGISAPRLERFECGDVVESR